MHRQDPPVFGYHKGQPRALRQDRGRVERERSEQACEQHGREDEAPSPRDLQCPQGIQKKKKEKKKMKVHGIFLSQGHRKEKREERKEKKNK